jgi:hypothetical protein
MRHTDALLSSSRCQAGLATGRLGWRANARLLEAIRRNTCTGRLSRLEAFAAGPTDTRVIEYTYYNSGELKSVWRDGVLSAEYEYDANGNRTRHTSPAVDATAYYDRQDRLTTYVDDMIGFWRFYTYDNDGDLASTSDTNTQYATGYSYDALGSLRAVDHDGQPYVTYRVDPSGSRIAVVANGTTTSRWLYAGGLLPAARLDGSGQITTRYWHATGRHVPDFQVENGRTYRLVCDHLGSVRAVVDTWTGEVVTRQDFDEWGVATLAQGAPCDFGFAGGLPDPNTGLIRFGARDYDSETNTHAVMPLGSIYHYSRKWCCGRARMPAVPGALARRRRPLRRPAPARGLHCLPPICPLDVGPRRGADTRRWDNRRSSLSGMRPANPGMRNWQDGQ